MKNTFHGVLLIVALIGSLAAACNSKCSENPLSQVPQPAAEETRFPPGVIRFQNADILHVLDLYQELSARTVLRPATLPWEQISLRNETELTRRQALKLIEDALAKAHVKMVLEGQKFVYAVPTDAKDNLPKFDANAVAAKLGKGIKPGEILPQGTMRFMDAEPAQVLPLYASLSGRKPLPPPANIPRGRFTIRSQTALTRAESLFAIEAIAALNHLQFQVVGDEEVQLVPLAAPRP